MKLLLVEDDDKLRKVTARGLTEAGHVIDLAADGPSGEAFAMATSYDAIVLDVMLPGKDGIAIVRALRAAGVRTPVLLLTARDAVEDTIAGLDAGADDYVRKPFVFGELEARLRTIARRDVTNRGAVVDVGELRFDYGTRTAARNGRDLRLTAREGAYLEVFVRNAGRIVTRRALEDALWTTDTETGSNVIDVYVRRLRTKLEEAGEERLLHTVRGVGYRLAATER